MPKWSKDQTEFTVNIIYASRGKKRFGRVTIPKPVLRKLKFPKELCFEFRNDEIILKAEVI